MAQRSGGNLLRLLGLRYEPLQVSFALPLRARRIARILSRSAVVTMTRSFRVDVTEESPITIGQSSPLRHCAFNVFYAQRAAVRRLSPTCDSVGPCSTGTRIAHTAMEHPALSDGNVA
jgi:hypothetical protein